jgi:oligopeptide transport system substrate-binding protein
LYILTTGAPLDNEGWSDPAYDALFRAASQTSDRTDRLRCFAQAETRLLAELPVMPLYSRSAEHLIKPTVLGWQPSPLDTFRTQDLRISR